MVVDLLRGGKVEVHLDHPEPVTDKPFREDVGKTCWSTEEAAQLESGLRRLPDGSL